MRGKASKKQMEAMKDPNSLYHQWPPRYGVEERIANIMKKHGVSLHVAMSKLGLK